MTNDTRLTIDRALQITEMMRRIMHEFVPYEAPRRYKLLEDLRELETNIKRDGTSEYSEDAK